VGTSSLRREMALRARFAHLQIVSVRGNVGTRLAKLDRGDFDALLMAAAGLQRLGMAERITQILSPEQQAELESFKRKVAETKLALKELRKNLRQDAESLVFWTKVVNIALMPILVALAGIVIALVRRRRQSAP